MQFTSNIIVALLLTVSTSCVTAGDGGVVEVREEKAFSAAQKSANLRGDGSMTFTMFPPTLIPSGSVLCPGKDESDYCDCGFDCVHNESFCECEEAQTKTCCGK